jgi:hypothetical protein
MISSIRKRFRNTLKESARESIRKETIRHAKPNIKHNQNERIKLKV